MSLLLNHNTLVMLLAASCFELMGHIVMMIYMLLKYGCWWTNKLLWVMMLVNEVFVLLMKKKFIMMDDASCICWIFETVEEQMGSIWQQVLTSCWWRIYDDDDDVGELIRGCWCRINDDDVVVVELWLLSVMTNLWWWWWWWGGGGGGGKKAAAYKSQISKLSMIHDGSSLWQLTESQ